MASRWKPAKACHDFNNGFTLFTAVPVLFITDNCVPNVNFLVCHLVVQYLVWDIVADNVEPSLRGLKAVFDLPSFVSAVNGRRLISRDFWPGEWRILSTSCRDLCPRTYLHHQHLYL